MKIKRNRETNKQFTLKRRICSHRYATRRNHSTTTLPPKAQNLIEPAQHKIQPASWVAVHKPKKYRLKGKKTMRTKNIKRERENGITNTENRCLEL